MKKYGNCWKIVFEPINEGNELLDSFMETFFDVVTIDYVRGNKFQYVGYTSTQPDEDLMKKSACECGVELPSYKKEFLPAENWLAKNVIKFPPLETEDFYIYGVHEEKVAKNNKLNLRIYAATAFGSGQHKTTQLCLKLIAYLYHNGTVAENVLDMGCGSGILAMAACKLWTKLKALAVDIDAEAVIVTNQNAKDNQLDNQIIALESNGFANDRIVQNAPYDMVFANILARPLIEMANDLANRLKNGGFAILSGFIEDQVPWVLDEYEKCGLKPLKILNDENWYAILLEKVK